MEKEALIKRFVKTYIVRHRRDRTIREIQKGREKFIDRLNHQITDIFHPAKLVELPQGVHQDTITEKLKIGGETLCYVFSHREQDDKIITFTDAFNQLFGNGLGFCLVPIEGDGIYIEGEREHGVPKRYVCC